MKEPIKDATFDQLRGRIERAVTTAEDKEDLLGALLAVEKAVAAIHYRLERTMAEKRTLSTLLARTSEDLEKSSELIKKMFGRYLSTEILNTLLDDPNALALGGERRQVAILVADLRGFTALSERLAPEQVVQMLNAWVDIMVDVIMKYHGTIDEIVGDALLVIFGAPHAMDDRAVRAVACAIDMQNAMADVDDRNRRRGLPSLEMGIGINDTEVIVGSIGSSKRSKYAVVGSGVNATSRIEACSVGGQILISESVYRKAGHLLRIDAQREILPKGMEAPLRIYAVGGISGPYHLTVDKKQTHLVTLLRRIPVRCALLSGNLPESEQIGGSIRKLSADSAQISMDQPGAVLTNLRMTLDQVDERLRSIHFYGKVVDIAQGEVFIRFTSLPPEIEAFFQAHLQHAIA